jgi:hypothetical protein
MFSFKTLAFFVIQQQNFNLWTVIFVLSFFLKSWTGTKATHKYPLIQRFLVSCKLGRVISQSKEIIIS